MKHQDLIDTLLALVRKQDGNLKFQRQFTHIVKQQANLQYRIEAQIAPYLKKYTGDYAQNFRHYRISSENKVLTDLVDSNVAYVGDFHPLNEAKEVLHTLLQQLLKQGRKITLAMELVRAEHQKFLDRYIKGELTELGFLQKIDYWKDWRGIPWDYYKPIFNLAKANRRRIKIVGIDSSHDGYSCHLRDYHAAKTISRAVMEQPDRIVVACMGDLHVAKQHFPEKAGQQIDSLGGKNKSVIIYQNRSSLYWELMEAKQLCKGTNVVQLSRSQNCAEYCILSASPVDKCISYINAGLYWFSKPEETVKNIHDAVVETLKHSNI